jgi:hypothetical protein
MALTENTVHEFQRPQDAKRRKINVAASTEIFKGAFIAIDAAGDAINAPATGAFTFVGVAEEYYNNTAVTATTDFPLSVRFEDILKHAVTGATEIVVGNKVYYTADDALSMTIVGGTGVAGSQVGRLQGFHKDTTPLVDLSKNEF